MQPIGKGPRRKDLRKALSGRYEFRVREHKGFGHGLRPGTTQDLGCPSCKRERDGGQSPVITSSTDRMTPEERLLWDIFGSEG